MAISRTIQFGVVLLALVLAGCGGGSQTGRVSGKFVYQGQPVVGVVVNLYCAKEGIGAHGFLDAGGMYSIQDAIPVGEYAVYLTRLMAVPPDHPDAGKPLPKASSFPSRYLLQESSGLIATVKPGANTVDFELKP
jgi:hypothetical protein